MSLQSPCDTWSRSQWLQHLEHEQTVNLGLERVKQVACSLDLCHFDCKVITVGGTNGKGSTVSALETIFHEAQYRVGAYTSPHLLDFNERIRTQLNPISDDALCDAFCSIEKARGEIQLTYFEMTTLAALWFFKQQALDVIILEVGLGGRLDATNIIDADVAVITTIDFDHQEFLGDTLEAIAYEKAGILRANKPFVYADINPPERLKAVVRELNARSCYLGGVTIPIPPSESPSHTDSEEGGRVCDQFFISDHHDFWDIHFNEYRLTHLPKPAIQLKSAAAACVATLLLQDCLPVTAEQYSRAMDKIFIHGRMQLHQSEVSILFDVSHNAQSAKLLADSLKNMGPYVTIHAVFSALKDKDLHSLIAPLKDQVHLWYIAPLENKRSSSLSLLHAVFSEVGILVDKDYINPQAAFAAAFDAAKPGDLIVVFGSFLTVGQVMNSWNNSLTQRNIP